MKYKITYKSTLPGLLLLLMSLLLLPLVFKVFFFSWVPNELKDLAREISREKTERAACFLPAAYITKREDRD